MHLKTLRNKIIDIFVRAAGLFTQLKVVVKIILLQKLNIFAVLLCHA